MAQRDNRFRIPSIGELLSTSLTVSIVWGGICLAAFGGQEIDDEILAFIVIGGFIFTIVCLIGARQMQAKDEATLRAKVDEIDESLRDWENSDKEER